MLRPHQSTDDLASHEPPGAFAAGVFGDDELIAVGLIGEVEPGVWRVRGMATAAEARRRGAGTAVLSALLEHAAAHGAHRVWANVRIAARTLYERAGFQVVSDVFELPGIGPHVRMELELSGS